LYANGHVVIGLERVAERPDGARVLELTQAQRAGLPQVGARIAQQSEKQVVGRRATVIAQHAGSDVANAAVVVADHCSKGPQYCRIEVVRSAVHAHVH